MSGFPIEIHIDPRDFKAVEQYYAGSGQRLTLIPAPGVRWALDGSFSDGMGGHDRMEELER